MLDTEFCHSFNWKTLHYFSFFLSGYVNVKLTKSTKKKKICMDDKQQLLRKQCDNDEKKSGFDQSLNIASICSAWIVVKGIFFSS